MKEKMKNYLNKRKEISEWLYYLGVFGIPIFGIISKNILLQGYIDGKNLYEPDIIGAISDTWKYWIFYILITMAVFSLSFIFKKNKNRLRYIFAIDCILTILLACDIIYSRSFFTLPSAANITILRNFSGFDGGEVTSLVAIYDIWFFIDFVALIIFLLLFKKREKNAEQERKILKKSYFVIIAMTIVAFSFIPIQANAFNSNVDSYEDMYTSDNAVYQAQCFTSLGFHIMDIYGLIKRQFQDDLTTDEQNLIDEYYEWKNEDLPDNEYKGLFEGKNVIFFQIESLEDFVINQSIDGQEICPNINKLASNGIFFPNIYEQVQGGNSSDADLMYMSSRLPILKGCTFFEYDNVELTSFPRFLVEDGYQTTYHQAVRGSFWNYKNALNNMLCMKNFVGMEAYDSEAYKIGFTINDESFLNDVYPYVKELNKPYYAHIVCNSSHMPFEIPKELEQLDLDEELNDSYIGGYLQEVRYVDTLIGEMLDKLEEDGQLENTVIIVIGDHCGIHKYYEYSLEPFYDEYPWFNNNNLYTVPLIINAFEEEHIYTNDMIAGQVDVMPTLCYLFGIDEDLYKNDAMGRNLLKTNRSYAIYRDGTVYGDLTEKEKNLVKKSYTISDMMFRVGK